MLDFKFDWCADVETGISIMDTQHKELFRIGREIEQLVICHCIGVTNTQLLNVIMELREYVAYHFYEEEKLMLENNYPNYAAHKAKHDETVHYIVNIDLKKLSLCPYEILGKLKTYLQDWIFSHLLVEDIALGNYLNKLGK